MIVREEEEEEDKERDFVTATEVDARRFLWKPKKIKNNKSGPYPFLRHRCFLFLDPNKNDICTTKITRDGTDLVVYPILLDINFKIYI